MAYNGYRLGENWAIEFQLPGLARPAKLVPGQITTDDLYSTADGLHSVAQFSPNRCYAAFFVKGLIALISCSLARFSSSRSKSS